MPALQTATSACAAAVPAAVPKEYPNGNPDAPRNPAGVRNTDPCLPLRRTGEVVHDFACDGPAPGDLPFRWIHGSVCAAKNTDPRIQVLAYNEDTYILRENPCIDWQAPFTYLLFGNSGALLIDTGATANPQHYPLRSTVDAIMSRWCSIRGRTAHPLTIVLTSAQDTAQNQGLLQFAARAQTTIMPSELHAIKSFFGLSAELPSGTGASSTSTAAIDLGGRIIDVLPTPGTHIDGLSFYDRYNAMLHTGDLFYPGRIQIANDRDYIASLARLQHWRETHPVKWVLGGHVDMMFVPGRAYPRYANNRPFEHVLQLEPALIQDALVQATAVQGKSKVVFRTDYNLLNRVGPDEKVYRTSPDLPEIPVPVWLP